MTTPSRSHMSYDIYDCEKYHEKFVKKALQQQQRRRRGTWMPKKAPIASYKNALMQQCENRQEQRQHVLLHERHVKNTRRVYPNLSTPNPFLMNVDNVVHTEKDFDWMNEVLGSEKYNDMLCHQILTELGPAEILSFSMTTKNIRKFVINYYGTYTLPAIVRNITTYNETLRTRVRDAREYRESFVDLRRPVETILSGVRITYAI